MQNGAEGSGGRGSGAFLQRREVALHGGADRPAPGLSHKSLEPPGHNVLALGFLDASAGAQHLFGMGAQIVEEIALPLHNVEPAHRTMSWDKSRAAVVP